MKAGLLGLACFSHEQFEYLKYCNILVFLSKKLSVQTYDY